MPTTATKTVRLPSWSETEAFGEAGIGKKLLQKGAPLVRRMFHAGETAQAASPFLQYQINSIDNNFPF